MKRRSYFGRTNRIPFAFIVGALLALIATARPALADRPGTPWKEKAYACFHYRTPAICAQFSNTADEDVTFDVETTVNGTPVAAWDVLKLNPDMRIDCDDDAVGSGTISCAQIHTNLWTSRGEFPTGTGANHKTTEAVCDNSGDCSANFNGQGPHIPPLGFDIYPVEPGSRWCFRFKARRVSDRVVSEVWSNWACATAQPPPKASVSASAAPLPPPKPVAPLGKHATWEYGRSITLDAFSPLGFSVRHRNFLGELTKVDRGNQVDREDATFIIRPALNGSADAVSFESVNFPGFFLRHQDFRLKLMQNDNSPLFKDDASFFKRAALAGGGATASFEATKFPGFYIRHRDFHVWLEKNDPPSDLFKKDATFLIAPGLAAPATAQQRTPEPVATGPATAPPNAQPGQAPEPQETEPAIAPPNRGPEQAPEAQESTKPAGGRPPPNPPGGRSAKVIADVPVYAGPGGNGEPVGMLRAGTTVTVLGPCPQSWCHVRGDDVPGGQGWVYDGAKYNSLQY